MIGITGIKSLVAVALLSWGVSILATPRPAPAASSSFNGLVATKPSFPKHPSAQASAVNGVPSDPWGPEQANDALPLQNLSITSQQLGLDGPLSLGANYSSLTGTFVNGQYVLPLGERWAIAALGEYGAEQYRLGGTVGFGFNRLSQLKVSAERLGQRLPFQWNSATVNEDVHQDALGLGYQHLFESPFLQAINAGAYYAKAANESFTPSGGSNYLNIAGAASSGVNLGVDSLLSTSTLAAVKLYYDQVQYSNAFGPTGQNQQGLGAGLRVDQLVVKRFKLFGEAAIRPVYDSYQAGLSYLPAFKKLPLEFSLSGQHLVSRNNTPDNNSVNFSLNVLADGAKTYDTQFAWNSKTLPAIADWSKTPAVYMQQVMVTQMSSGGGSSAGVCIGDSYLGGIVYAITGGGTCGTSGTVVSATNDATSSTSQSDASTVCSSKTPGSWSLPPKEALSFSESGKGSNDGTIQGDLCPGGLSCPPDYGFSATNYWSSSVFSTGPSTEPWVVNFPSGIQSHSGLSVPRPVRCIRSF